MEDCCKDKSNLELQPTNDSDTTVRICQVCGRRHYSLRANLNEAFGLEVKNEKC